MALSNGLHTTSAHQLVRWGRFVPTRNYQYMRILSTEVDQGLFKGNPFGWWPKLFFMLTTHLRKNVNNENNQTIHHIVNECPNRKFSSGLTNLLDENGMNDRFDSLRKILSVSKWTHTIFNFNVFCTKLAHYDTHIENSYLFIHIFRYYPKCVSIPGKGVTNFIFYAYDGLL